MPKIPETLTEMRIDKWLWCARFYKTRTLASEAVKNGRVLLGGERTKPSKTVQTGDQLRIRKGAFHYEITLLQLSKGRKSATEAVALYEETADSLQQRETLALQLKATAGNAPRTKGRPTKRDRRELIKFKYQQ